MFNTIGYSVYLSNYPMIKEQLSSLSGEGCYVFTSFHISEEFSESYPEKMKKMCEELREMGCRLTGDVSRKTLFMFSCESIPEFAEKMGLSAVRIDYGFTEKEIIEIGKKLPVCVNASTLEQEAAARIASQIKEVYGIHNFYPRPETGLDQEFFSDINWNLKKAGVKTIAFIPGDICLRKPLCAGLPTLESHRGAAPYAAYVDMKKGYQAEGIFVGDGILSSSEAELIQAFEKDGIVRLPMELSSENRSLYGRTFTIRGDSPGRLKRFQESREYSCLGEKILPVQCTERVRGTLTVDNEKYLRYSGEIQLIIEDLPADERVNIIGKLKKGYDLLLNHVNNSEKIMLVE